MLVGDVVVDATRRVPRDAVGRVLIPQLFGDRIGQGRHCALSAGGSDVSKQLADGRIDRRGQARAGGQVQQIHVAALIAENALLGGRGQDDPVLGVLTGRARLFVVDEEERLVTAVEQARDADGAADPRSRLVQDVFSLRDVVAVVEPGVRVELVVAQVVVGASPVLVGAGAGGELYLDGPLTGRRGALRRRADGDLLYRVEARADTGEEPVARLQVVVLGAHAVNRDVDGALRQTVDRGVAGGARRVHPRQGGDEVERAAAACRQLRNLVDVEGGRHRRRLRLDDRGAPFDDDGLLEAADIQLHGDAGGHTGIHPDVVENGGLEAHEGDGYGVAARVEGRDAEGSRVGRDGRVLRRRRVVLDDHGRTGNDGARRVRYGPRNR